MNNENIHLHDEVNELRHSLVRCLRIRRRDRLSAIPVSLSLSLSLSRK